MGGRRRRGRVERRVRHGARGGKGGWPARDGRHVAHPVSHRGGGPLSGGAPLWTGHPRRARGVARGAAAAAAGGRGFGRLRRAAVGIGGRVAAARRGGGTWPPAHRAGGASRRRRGRREHRRGPPPVHRTGGVLAGTWRRRRERGGGDAGAGIRSALGHRASAAERPPVLGSRCGAVVQRRGASHRGLHPGRGRICGRWLCAAGRPGAEAGRPALRARPGWRVAALRHRRAVLDGRRAARGGRVCPLCRAAGRPNPVWDRGGRA
jgi:hypothetical protein